MRALCVCIKPTELHSEPSEGLPVDGRAPLTDRWPVCRVRLRVMTWRHPLRIVLHLLLAVGLVLPGIAANAQATRQMLALASGVPGAMSHASCDGMSMPDKSPSKAPPGTSRGCNLAACLGAGCLPALPRVTAFVPAAQSPITLDEPLPPSQLPDTPLRPPIA